MMENIKTWTRNSKRQIFYPLLCL